MIRPITYLETCISNNDNVLQTCFIFDNTFEVSLWQFVRTRHRQIIAIGDSAYEFFLQKIWLYNQREWIELIKYSFLYFLKLNYVERKVKSLPEII